MSKRGDNIHKRKDGRWEGRVTIGKDNAGTRRYYYLWISVWKDI